MRKAFSLAAGLLALAIVNFSVYQRETLLREGRIVLLELSPVDPRSLMQGDYMRLNFEVADRAFPRLGGTAGGDGRIVVAIDPQGVARFSRFADARPLAPGEVALRYRIRGGRPNFATNAWFFQEGQAGVYANARYGEFRVARDGEMILTALRGPRLERLAAAQ